MDLPKEFTLHEIAAVAGGKVGAGGDTKVKRVAFSPLQAEPGDLALIFDKKVIARLSECKASAVVVPEGVECSIPHITVKRPTLALQKMLTAVQPKRFHPAKGVHPSAVVDPTAELAADVSVGPLVVIGPHTKVGARTIISAGCLIGGKVQIGEDCLLHQGSKVADYVKLGNRVILQQGASIGSDGFGYVTEVPSNMELRLEGKWDLSDAPNPLLKIPQTGIVIIEDDVEVGSSSCIDRATMGATIIGAGTKIDNLVHVAHNTKMGRENIAVAGVCVGGSCTLGDRVVLAGQAGLKEHIKIGNDAIVQGQAGVISDLEAGKVVCGGPALPVKEFFGDVAARRKLPAMVREVRELKAKMEQLEKALLERNLEQVK